MNTQEILIYVDEQNRKTRQYIEATQNNYKFAEDLIKSLKEKEK
jgi:hypothetical protein